MKTRRLFLLIALVMGSITINYARKDSIDFVKFKESSEIRLKENERKIRDFKAELLKEESGIRDKYNLKISVIEKRNDELEERLAGNKENGSDSDQFEHTFNKDLDDLRSELRELVDSKKDPS